MTRPDQLSLESMRSVVSLQPLASDLTPQEQSALAEVVAFCIVRRPIQLPRLSKARLGRLLQPLNQVMALWGMQAKYCTAPVQIILLEMFARSTSYWAWSETEWEQILTTAFARFSQNYAASAAQPMRQQMLAIAYEVGPQTDFFLPFLGEETWPQALACRLLGKGPFEGALEHVCEVLKGWGYMESTKQGLATTLAEVLLVNRSAQLEAVSFLLLIKLHERMKLYQRGSLERLSKVLAFLGIIERPLPPASESKQILSERLNTEGIAPEWVEWCLTWHRYSNLTSRVKRAYLLKLFQAGRWLAAQHPEVTTPHEWTAKLAAEYVAVVDLMKEGDYCAPEYTHRKKGGQRRASTPLSAGTKEKILCVMRTFFQEIQSEPHQVPRRFDPARAFRTPRAIQDQLGPNPRDLNPLLWAKMVHAALGLKEEELPRGSRGIVQYPLALVRALAAVWVYSGLRSDEIVRLHIGCIRWQQEDVTVPETGEVLPKDAICFLTVPVNKTTSTFQKPVNPLVGRRINEWEGLRASNQPLRSDRKTGTLVDYLFCHRGNMVSRGYINRTLIPLLCEKAGIPRADERGAITSHRARATLATLLYNAPEGLSIFDLMQWLGHKDPKTTQHYTKIKPLKLAAAYSKADRNSRLVEVLVDTKADTQGRVNVYYVLGDHGLCGNPDWASCIYRMACMKCPFFVPREQAQLIESSRTVKRFMEVVELTDEELAAAQEDYEKLQETTQRTQHLVSPTVLQRRAKGSTQRGIPLVVLNSQRLVGEEPIIAEGS